MATMAAVKKAGGLPAPEGVERLAREYEPLTPQAMLERVLREHGRSVALACSFGLEDVALVDMMVRIDPKARVFCLDTGRLHQETYDVMDQVRARYKIEIEVYFPQAPAVEEMVRSKGMNLFYDSIENRKLCCNLRKVEPLGRALKGLGGWITGLRRDQNVTRTETAKVEVDAAHGGILKFNPLATWSVDDVWAYIRKNSVPYNALHDRGFPSIGCAPCTRAVQPGEDLRAGRWWWEDPKFKECGLHTKKAS